MAECLPEAGASSPLGRSRRLNTGFGRVRDGEGQTTASPVPDARSSMDAAHSSALRFLRRMMIAASRTTASTAQTIRTTELLSIEVFLLSLQSRGLPFSVPWPAPRCRLRSLSSSGSTPGRSSQPLVPPSRRIVTAGCRRKSGRPVSRPASQPSLRPSAAPAPA